VQWACFYKAPQGGAPVWMETQNVQAAGHYSATLGCQPIRKAAAGCGSAIKRITAGVKAGYRRSLPSFDLMASLHPPGKSVQNKKISHSAYYPHELVYNIGRTKRRSGHR
jgi:hypothetical protein